MHVFPIAKKIRPGIQIWRLVERLVNILKVEGKQKCPEFCDEDGFQLYAAVLESVIHPILRRMQRYKHHKEIFLRTWRWSILLGFPDPQVGEP